MGVFGDLGRAHSEASDERERTFTALALLFADPNSFKQLENQLRIDLAKISWNYLVELQWDILDVLSRCPNSNAQALAKGWAPFYSPALAAA